MHRVAIELGRDVDRLESQTHNAAHASAQWHDPTPATRRLPICGNDRRRHDIPTLLHIVIYEPLQKHLVHIGAAAITADRPPVIEQRAEDLVPGRGQNNDRRAHAEFPLTQLVGGGRGITNVGPAPQINLPGFAGEKKNVGFMSPKPEVPSLCCDAMGSSGLMSG
jgi:hypothetical protein